MIDNGDLRLGIITSRTSSMIDESLGQGVVVKSTYLVYLAPGDTSGIFPISFQLTAYATNASDVWMDLKERFDKVDDSHSFNLHREIATMVQADNQYDGSQDAGSKGASQAVPHESSSSAQISGQGSQISQSCFFAKDLSRSFICEMEHKPLSWLMHQHVSFENRTHDLESDTTC
ncbi:hypothetical protein HAX54_007899 [Datura stramonium]|uniref:Uncharacterized protein n=1 Tax=Datura stramonium TaxID=4076 RepID=A0ABS8TD60_DATST|nr:hypothetical protein [Datura stramonium]